MAKRNLLIVILSLLLVVCSSAFVACGDDSSVDTGSDGGSVSTPDSSNEPQAEYVITGVSMPAYYGKYLATIEGGSDSVFTTVEDKYKVGDDNAMTIRPVVAGLDLSTGAQNSDIQDLQFVITIAKWNGTEYVVMDNPGTDVDVNAEAVTVDFAEETIGNCYKVSVYPQGLSESQLNKLENYTVSMEFEVVDGYNASSVIEFSLIDNANKNIKVTSYDYCSEEWAEMRKQAGITVDPSSLNGIVLHADLSIDNTNVPKGFFYNEGDADLNKSDADYERAKGSLRDWSAIFARYNHGEQFNVYGNYFSISTENMPLIARDSGDIMNADAVVNSHATLLFVDGVSDPKDSTAKYPEIRVSNTNVTTIENLDVLGNLKLSDTFQTGGLNFAKFNCQKTVVDNVISRQWYITAFAEYNEQEEGKLLIKDCQYYDNYSFFLYSYGGYIEVENSIMKSCGGPVIMADNCEYGGTEKPEGYVPTFVVDEKSVLESWVAGTETWFIQNSATSVVSAIVGLDALFNYQGGVTYVKTEKDVAKINLIMVLKSGDAEGMSFDKISGSATIGDLKVNMDNPILLGFGGRSVLFQGASEQAFLAMNYGLDGTPYLADAMTMAGAMAQGQMPPAVTPADNHAAFTGDYLGMFVSADFAGGSDDGYLGVVLGGYRAL